MGEAGERACGGGNGTGWQGRNNYLRGAQTAPDTRPGRNQNKQEMRCRMGRWNFSKRRAGADAAARKPRPRRPVAHAMLGHYGQTAKSDAAH